ncbi:MULTISPECIES: hypothetical protein [Clostridium]|uniref:hypothetical protein n=1 Tax=Clostridium TaxID=1485 RepID=UPI00069F4DAC|nr:MULTISPECIES: hypothetical protein [Clostridium]KOF55846.1 hypothetical protein AGR56_02040 [Clostridium sp. DMHC 10]MCD2348563.1 hypothetical protein [Clostridium guangxiense]
MDENNIFVRLSYKGKDENKNSESEKSSIKTKVRNCNISSQKYMIGGGVYNRKGGTIFFAAKNLKEVNDVTQNKNAFVKNSLVKYHIFIVPKALECR